MKLLETDRLILRNWLEADRELFHEINSDEQVMQFFPMRRNRYQSDQMMDHVRDGISRNGFGFTPVELKKTGECLGFCGIHYCGEELNLPAGTVEIGWRLSPRHWGKGYASEAAKKWLEFAFLKLDLNEIVSFAVRDNLASIAVMKRIGMTADPKLDYDHQSVPKHMPELRPHVLYALTKQQWVSRIGE
jgi:RimJ/RimL family protein N-acetyltransferase